MKIIIVGANGQLGWELIQLFAMVPQFQIVPLPRQSLDITSACDIDRVFEDVQPQIVINAAAFTHVDDCETQQTKAFAVNATGARNVARSANRANAKLIHVSTDYVFDGKKPSRYMEEDDTAPLNVYGASKLEGERHVQEECSQHFIVRTAWLYGLNGNNFVKTMLQLGSKGESISVVDDQFGNPTWTCSLAQQIKELLPTDHYGIYHATCQGACSWYDFACEIFDQASITVSVKPVSSRQFARPARRPKNSILNNTKLQKLGLDVMPPWQEGLKGFMKEFKNKNVR